MGEGKAENAIDGSYSVEETSSDGGSSNCAWGSYRIGSSVLSYLRVDLRADWVVKAVGLFFRASWRRRWQDGLEVRVSTEAELLNSSQCGRNYNHRRDGSNPIFRCGKVTRYIWVARKSISWSQTLQVCEIEVFEDTAGVRNRVLNFCSHPSAILNGNVTSSGLSVGSVATYQCKDGHYLIGPSQIKCESTGIWSHEPPLCTSNLNAFTFYVYCYLINTFCSIGS